MDTPAATTMPPGADGGPRRVAASAFALAAIAVAITALLAGIHQLTQARIARNQLAWIEEPLKALLAPVQYDNDVVADSISVVSRDLLGTSEPVVIYRARQANEPVAAVIHLAAPDGYRGPIDLLIAIDVEGVLLGVQVIQHNETPGLGDAFETRNAGWLQAFRGLSLDDPPQHRWTVRRDGGDFDAFTGATITPRAIVKAVRRALEYFRAQRSTIFREAPQ